MLGFFRQNLNSIAIKVLMALLAFTFILWGVGDMFRGGSGNTYIFKVGDFEFSQHDWKEAINTQVQYLNYSMGKTISHAELKEAHFYESLLQQLIDKFLIITEAKKLGLIISDEMVKYELISNPMFHDEQGNFNKEIFEIMLKNRGMKEAKFINLVKEDMMHKNLAISLTTNQIISPQLSEQMYKAYNTIKLVKLYELDKNTISLDTQPSEQELEHILENHKEKFYLPEKRYISYISFGLKNIDSKIDVTKEELEALYREKQFLFTTPERRKVYQIILGSEEEAVEARSALVAGSPFETAAKKYAPKQKDILLGTVTREGFDDQIADVIFTLNQDEISQPIQTPLGFHIFQVTKIIPETVAPFDKVKNTIKRQYIEDQKFERLSTLAQKIDNTIATGSSLQEIAHQYNLDMKNTTITSDKKTNEKAITSSESFKLVAFSTELNSVSMVTPYNDDKFFIIQVNNITPRQLQKFADIKDELTKIWQTEQTEQKLRSVALNLKSLLAKDENISKINIKTRDVEVSKSKNTNLPKQLVDDIMILAPDKISAPYRTSTGNYILAKVIKTKPLKAEEKNIRIDQMQSQIMLIEYLDTLKKKYPVTINHELYQNLD